MRLVTEVGAHVWRERAVIFSYTDTRERHEFRRMAVAMFRSIVPEVTH